MLKADLCIKVAAIIEITAVFLTANSGKEMKKNTNKLLFHNITNDIGHTGFEDESLQRKHFVTELFAENVAKTEYQRIIDESDDLQNEGVKTIIQSNILVVWIRLGVLLGLKLSGHTDTLTEASNL